MLSKLKISHKIYGLGAIQLLLIILMGSVGYIQMSKIGVALFDIAEEDIPATKMLTVLTEHQLQEAILFERAIRINFNMQVTGIGDSAHFEDTRNKINSLTKKSLGEFKTTKAFVSAGIQKVHTKEAKNKYTQLLNDLSKASNEYDKVIKESNELLAMVVAQEDAALIGEKLLIIEKHRDGIDHALIKMLDNIQEFTLKSALKAEHDEIAGIQLIMVLMVVSVAAGILLPLIIGKAITRPILVLNERLDEIASGDGDLTVTLSERALDETGDTARAFNIFVDKIRSTISSVSDSVEVLETSSNTTTQEMNQTSESIEQQRNEIEMVASAVEQMNSTIQEVATNTGEASDMANSVKSTVELGQESANESHSIIEQLAQEIETASATIGTLAEKTDGIGMVLDTIRAIAEQTNLLALNAAIEAARAGETGRGFAVVADEVRSLAQRTQSSTGDIQALVEDLQAEAKNAVESMDKGSESTKTCLVKSGATGAAFHDVSNIVNHITALNEQIATATEEQSAVANEVNMNLTNITSLAAETTVSAKNTSEANEAISSGISELRTQVQQFKT